MNLMTGTGVSWRSRTMLPSRIGKRQEMTQDVSAQALVSRRNGMYVHVASDQPATAHVNHLRPVPLGQWRWRPASNMIT
jgi:hypothetical protein